MGFFYQIILWRLKNEKNDDDDDDLKIDVFFVCD